jgi:hypothetical protein
MQIIAEEKKKEYCCLVYSERPLTAQDMNLLKRATVSSSSSNETDGQEPGLEVTQRTPLRVCHRRSCIERTKFVYSMDGLLLNGHFFLLKLTTSAGKKENQLCIIPLFVTNNNNNNNRRLCQGIRSLGLRPNRPVSEIASRRNKSESLFSVSIPLSNCIPLNPN